MPVGLFVLAGALIGVALFTVSGKFGLEVLEADGDLREAAGETRTWAMGALGAFAGLVATGYINLGHAVEGFFSILGGHPFALSNLFAGGLGWAALEGLVEPSPELFLGVSLAFAGLAFAAREAKK